MKHNTTQVDQKYSLKFRYFKLFIALVALMTSSTILACDDPKSADPNDSKKGSTKVCLPKVVVTVLFQWV